jgi:hypothetical protein
MARADADMNRILEELSALKDSVAAMARDGVAEAGDAVRSAAKEAGAMAAEKSEEAANVLRGRIRGYPIASVAAAFTIGLSAARLLLRR